MLTQRSDLQLRTGSVMGPTLRELMADDSGTTPNVRVTADRETCIGTGECHRLVPRAFDEDDEGLVVVLDTSGVALELLRLAERACPSGAITVTGKRD